MIKIKKIQWGELQEPTASVPYTHIFGTCGLGLFLISWKGWKLEPDYNLEQTPWGDSNYFSSDIEELKQRCQTELEERILSSLELDKSDDLPNP